MSKLQKSLIVPTIIVGTLSWAWFISKAIESNDIELEKSNQAQVKIEDYSLSSQYGKSFKVVMDEYERLKEEERKRLAELQRQRLEKIRLEKLRLAEIERQKRLDEQKKKQRQVVSRGSNDTVGNWRTFDGSYYGSDCYKCSGITTLGIDVRNTIYYNGLRIIATDPKVIKLGSIVEVKSPNETFKAYVADTGGKIKNFKVDILVQSEAIASQYGRHNVQIRVLKEPVK